MLSNLLSDQWVLYLIYLGIGVGVLLTITALQGLARRSETGDEARSRRMRMIRQGHSIEERLSLLKLPEKNSSVARIPLLGNLPRQLRRAGLPLSPAVFLALCGGLVVLTFGVLMLKIAPGLSAAVALSVGIGLPLAALRLRVNQQVRMLTTQLPDALDLMARGLRVGHPLNTSIGAVAQEMADPIGSEFGLIYDQVNYGEDLPDAFQDFAENVDIEDVHYLSSSIGIQHGTGSDLAKVIEVMSRVIRQRMMMRRKIHAISAEGRLTAGFLTLVPGLMFGFTSLSSPRYYGDVMGDPLFVPMAVAVVLLTTLNGIIMFRLVNFHI